MSSVTVTPIPMVCKKSDSKEKTSGIVTKHPNEFQRSFASGKFDDDIVGKMGLENMRYRGHFD
jgi:hypothetical protein